MPSTAAVTAASRPQRTPAEVLPFPFGDRVVYRRDPLQQVVAQIRFPQDLRLESESPAEFQARVRDLFPLLERQVVATFPGVPQEIAKHLEGLVPNPPRGVSYQFKSEDKKSVLSLSSSKLTLTTERYDHWEAFRGRWAPAMEALLAVYTPAFLTRLGLRYVDAIDRNDLGLEDAKWSELFQPFLTGEIGESDWIERHTKEASRTLVFELPDDGLCVRVHHGIGQKTDSGANVYFIDSDYFTIPDRTELSDALETFNRLNSYAGPLFRWCITPRLDHALEPEPRPG